jgi:hypothetical protein
MSIIDPNVSTFEPGDVVFRPNKGSLWVVVGNGAGGSVIVQHLPVYLSSVFNTRPNMTDLAVATVERASLARVRADDITPQAVTQFLAEALGTQIIPESLIALCVAFAQYLAFPSGVVRFGGHTGASFIAFVVCQIQTLQGPPSQGMLVQFADPKQDEALAIGKQFASLVGKMANRADSPGLAALYQGFFSMLAHGADEATLEPDALADRVDATALALARRCNRRIEELHLEESASATVEPKGG